MDRQMKGWMEGQINGCMYICMYVLLNSEKMWSNSRSESILNVPLTIHVIALQALSNEADFFFYEKGQIFLLPFHHFLLFAMSFTVSINYIEVNCTARLRHCSPHHRTSHHRTHPPDKNLQMCSRTSIPHWGFHSEKTKTTEPKLREVSIRSYIPIFDPYSKILTQRYQ